MDFQRFNNADTDQYKMMQTNQPPADPRVEVQLELCEDEDVIPEPIFPMKISFHIEMSRYAYLNRSNIMLVSEIQNAAG